LLIFAGEEIEVWRFLGDWSESVGGACDICSDDFATGIFLHKSLNYISNPNL
jgi:hypothetical protein